jgi:hypothetical protein
MRSIGRVGQSDATAIPMAPAHFTRLPHPDRYAVCPSP